MKGVKFKNDVNKRSLWYKFKSLFGYKGFQKITHTTEDITGRLFCMRCDHIENIVVFLNHSEDNHSVGYQCRKCGKFELIQGALDLREIPSCSCGGRLSANRKFFCPSCHYRKYVLFINTKRFAKPNSG